MKCFHHNDLDGRVAGFLATLFLGCFEKYADGFMYREVDCDCGAGRLELVTDYDLLSVGYSDFDKIDNVLPGETVFFVDLSFSENTKHYLDELKEKGCKIVWIDHHQSSLDLIEEYPEYGEIAGVRDNSRCGAWLTWEWFTDIKNAAEAGIDTTIMFWGPKEHGCPIHPEKSYLSPYCINKESMVPTFVALTDDYDRWQHEYPQSKALNLIHIMYGKNPTCSFYYHLFLDYLLYESHIRNCDVCYCPATTLPMDSTLMVAVHRGQMILDYKLTSEHTQWFSRGFTGYLTDGEKEYKCACLNIQSNSDAFPEDVIENYDALSIFSYSLKGGYKYSVYSTREDVDCNAICKHYGGGGHKGAAGFNADSIVYTDMGPRI